MSRGKKPILFDVGQQDIDGHEIIKVMSTSQVHKMISSMNGSSEVVFLVIKKKAKQRKIKLSES